MIDARRFGPQVGLLMIDPRGNPAITYCPGALPGVAWALGLQGYTDPCALSGGQRGPLHWELETPLTEHGQLVVDGLVDRRAVLTVHWAGRRVLRLPLRVRPPREWF